jgi:hypothetical protein
MKHLFLNVRLFSIFILAFSSNFLNGQLQYQRSTDSILGHKVVLDKEGHVLSWYKPEIPGRAYSHVSKLASEYLLKKVPTDPKTGLPLYLVTCCFQKNNKNQIIGEEWPHNPACFYAGSVQSFAVQYYQFTGDTRFIELVRGMLDHQLNFGTTPSDFKWPEVPYASSDPFEKIYNGATQWEHEASRGDGLHVIEPDKVGELGISYLKFYEITSDQKYLRAAINCASSLAKNIRDLSHEKSPFIATITEKSPWPFRVNARTGVVVSEYCSNVIEPIRLFDELIRIKDIISLDTAIANDCIKALKLATDWLFSRNGPMHTYIWNAYFEDIPNDPDRTNRNQLTPGEVAKYLIRNPKLSPDIKKDVPALIYWIASVFKTDNLDAIKEQTWCYEPMGSHTARYGAVCAMWYAYTGDTFFKEQAYRFLNVATYMTLSDGYVAVGPTWPGAWFSDGYSDYVRHFMDALAAVPEWAPEGENHMLFSTSIVQSIQYSNSQIDFKVFDNVANVVFRLKSKPKKILINGNQLIGYSAKSQNTWLWEENGQAGVLRISWTGGNSIIIKL